MTDATFTDRLGLILQAYASNPETWGTELNNAVIRLMDDTVAYEPITVDADVTLSADDGLENQVRRTLLPLIGAGGHTVTVKSVDRFYLVYNACAADVEIKPEGGTGSTVRAGSCVIWTTDGATASTFDVPLDRIRKPEADVDFNGKKIVNLAAPTGDDDAVTKQYVDDAKGEIDSRPLNEFTKPDAALDLNGKKAINLGAPTDPADAATKGYIDTLAASSSLGTVAAIADEIVAVAANESNVVTVAENIANVNTVAANITSVDLVADNIADVQNAGAIVDEFKNTAFWLAVTC
ncbi:hypothetical protein [Aquamicrobium zhengzhouense]|uniref:Uncharacterized protein n=1 Tax=Aquamicrobium zhengzhouense TaxID=2781738 RepID=A0ABS0SAP2_9HYPH|nr:hypothetical protein [Aquamicrobium zhengzhouense]MBI1620358.1 hypothetical protein [Aquamicrobium zhengzhouense]